MADILTEILRSANKHPNSRVSKLIHTVEEDPSQKNIVLLLIELAEHAEYSIDFNISLKYYLDLFERLGINHDLVLSEAGLLLVNSSKIYSKRVDYVQSLVERQIFTLTIDNAEIQHQKLDQQQESQNENATLAEKPKRSRKRALEVQSDPYETELMPKKFKRLTDEKRFGTPKEILRPKSIQRNIEMEQYIHPAGWLHATIYDLDNEEEVDTKRNYKLFTYHVEHRYNTLVPDINFRLHFKVKDYMDEQEEMEEDEECNTARIWPPLSEAYVQKYISLENYILQQDVNSYNRKQAGLEIETSDVEESNKEINGKQLNSTLYDVNKLNKNDELSGNNYTELSQNQSDDLNKTSNDGELNCNLENTAKFLEISGNTEIINDSTLENQQESDSALGTSLLDQTNNTEMNATSETSGNLQDTNISIIEKQHENDSALDISVLDQKSDTEVNIMTATSVNMDSRAEASDISNIQVNETGSNTSILGNTTNTETNTPTEISGNLDAGSEMCTTLTMTVENQEEGEKEVSKAKEELKTKNEDVLRTVENLKDLVLNNDRTHPTSLDNLAILAENLNQSSLEFDVNPQTEKKSTQIKSILPHTEDEGVYLSDLEDQDFRLLSPVIKTVNILPGCKRKDVTIYLDDELREALDMRDAIMEHFSQETYKVPVLKEPIKQKLIFNILKLPEKMVRRKILFKMGPEMDLFLQARFQKRSKLEPITRPIQKLPNLEWFSLNNSDMSDVNMTSPFDTGDCSDFYGFTDDEDDDNISCSEFCGFTEEEQVDLLLKNINRLSRDSGVGVDVNNLASEKEPLGIIIEQEEALQVSEENYTKNLILDEEPIESTKALLNQLPADIREVLTNELHESDENATQTIDENAKENVEVSTETPSEILGNNTEGTYKLSTEDDLEYTEKSSTGNNSHDSQLLSIGNLNSNNTRETENETVMNIEQNTEQISLSSESQENSQNKSMDAIASEITKEISNTEVETPCPTNTEDCNKSAEVLINEKLDCNINSQDNDCLYYNNHVDEENDDSIDDIMLDLNAKGTKTKIQQWHEHLQPILAKSRERHHFDIFKLGSEIIDILQNKSESSGKPSNDSKSNQQNNKPEASFHDIMDNIDKSYVSRYFLSTLLLANQSNLEISVDNKSSEKPSLWHDIHLKLISTKRHMVAIEDNIGMVNNRPKEIDVKAKSNQIKISAKKCDKSVKDIDDGDENGDEALIKIQNTKKTSLKRSNDVKTSTPLAEKKPREINHLIKSVQILPMPPTSFQKTLPLNIMPSTSLQTKVNESHHANSNSIRTLQPIEKVQKLNDDLDSGIFSIDEMSLS